MKTIYFVDFDNTVSSADVWDSIITEFARGDWKRIVRDYENHRISSREFNSRLMPLLRGEKESVRSFILKFDIDPVFTRFVDLARRHNRDLLLISDGYDFYIDLLLEKGGVRGVKYFSNHMEWIDGRPVASFPHFRPECQRKMANCKCQYLRLGDPGLRRVYIGDGVSDICAAEKADLVYAKADLRKYFEENNRTFRPFETLADIIDMEFPAI